MSTEERQGQEAREGMRMGKLGSERTLAGMSRARSGM